MEARHLVSETVAALPAMCTSTFLPQNAVLTLADGQEPLTLAAAAVFEAPCQTLAARAYTTVTDSATVTATDVAITTETSNSSYTYNNDTDSPRISDFRDPFYASTFPMCYALAACTVVSYMLVIMLFVTPRSFLDGGVIRLSRRSFTNASSDGISIGGRPWLQKVAALTVAVSLTVATADTFHVAEEQYSYGAQNAQVLQNEVMGSVELKVIRLISDTFLWLAQAQTLIRLFPRQREKIIIKWVAFLLITLDLIFSALTSFLYSENGVTGTSFSNPIPTLSYLFQLSLGVLYAAWVLYYSWMKKRYAYYHPVMKNISLVALISITSILIPIVFFILDISKPSFTAWGDYVRWVGAAAASVVVWEWVERIEALEREEKKDGILGREVFNDDDMLEIGATDFPSLRHRKFRKVNSDSSSGSNDRDQGGTGGPGWPSVSAITNRRHRSSGNGQNGSNEQPTHRRMGDILHPTTIWPARPPPAVTPVSRTDTASAASTVYAVRYQGGSDGTNRTPDLPMPHNAVEMHRLSGDHGRSPGAVESSGTLQGASRNTASDTATSTTSSRSVDLEANRGAPSAGSQLGRSRTSSQSLHGSREDSAADVTRQQYGRHHLRDQAEASRWDLRSRLEMFAVNQAEKIRERLRPTTDAEDLAVHVVPAPARPGAALQQVLEEEELAGLDGARSRGQDGVGDSSRDTSGDMALLDRDGHTDPERPLPQDYPPLWPGVQQRVPVGPYFDDEDDEYSFESSSVAEDSASLPGSRRESYEGSGRGQEPRVEQTRSRV